MRRKGKKIQSATRLGYNERHAKSGITAPLPDIETFPNQYKGYEITIEIPEYTAICPKTGLPDFGIFYENSVNRVLQDIVKACRPVWAKVTGTFAARGGLRSVIEARFP